MSYDTDIQKLQEQLELLKKQKEENDKNKINLDGYLEAFETIEQIDNEIEKLCTDNLTYCEIKKYANLIYTVNDNNNEQNKIFDPTKLLDIDILNVFTNYKDFIKLYYENKKTNNKLNQSFDDNTNTIMINKIFKLINIITQIKGVIEKDKDNIYKCYNSCLLNGFVNKYIQKLNVRNIFEVDINKIIDEIDYDISMFKMFYFDSIIFIKQNQKLLSEYPENYEQLVQIKIIELNKKKLSLL